MAQEALIPPSSNFTTLYGKNPEYPESNLTEVNQKWSFRPAWDLNYSVPFYCLAVFAFLNMKNDAIFNRFGAFGSFTNFSISFPYDFRNMLFSIFVQILKMSENTSKTGSKNQRDAWKLPWKAHTDKWKVNKLSKKAMDRRSNENRREKRARLREENAPQR